PAASFPARAPHASATRRSSDLGRFGAEREDRREGYLLQERTSGSFARTISLPGMFDPDAVTSEFRDGELRVSLPKAPESRARRIDRKSTRLNSSHEWSSYAVFC